MNAAKKREREAIHVIKESIMIMAREGPHEFHKSLFEII